MKCLYTNEVCMWVDVRFGCSGFSVWKCVKWMRERVRAFAYGILLYRCAVLCYVYAWCIPVCIRMYFIYTKSTLYTSIYLYLMNRMRIINVREETPFDWKRVESSNSNDTGFSILCARSYFRCFFVIVVERFLLYKFNSFFCASTILLLYSYVFFVSYFFYSTQLSLSLSFSK